MKKKVIIWGGIAIVAGIATYFLVKRFRKPQTPDAPPVPEVLPPAGGGGGNEGGGGGSSAPSELDSKAKILAFQQWVINTKKDKTILGSGGASGYGDDGSWGGKTSAAWDKYGAIYKNEGGGSGSGGADAALEKAINLILAKASNEKGKATRSYLLSADPSFVKTWAWNLDNDRKAFGWTNGTWRVKTGQQLLNYNPIEVEYKTKSGGIYAHKLPSPTSEKTGVGGDKNIGKIRAVSFDGTTVWFYAPDGGGDYKWGRASDLKKA
jgi:hypothetical protein